MKRGPFVWCVFVDYDRLGSKWWSGVMAIKTVSQTVRVVFVSLASSARLSVTRSVTPSACFVLHIKTTVLTRFIYCTVVCHPRNLRFCLLMSLEVQGFLTEIKTTCFCKKTAFSASLVTSCSIFNLTWSFRNHSNVLICCFKKILLQLCAA